jgi:hypothetical protein
MPPYFLKIQAMLSSLSTSILVPLLKCSALDGCDVYSGLMVQEIPRKLTKPAFTEKTRLDGKTM